MASSDVRRSSPAWIVAATVALVLAAAFFGHVLGRNTGQAAPSFRPTQQNPDPSRAIPGVRIVQYRDRPHVAPDQRVAYDHSPPFGGPHDGVWADCTGVVYPRPVRNENMVHSLEHGAVWIAYAPGRVDDAGLRRLAARVDGKPYTMMSPYPGLDRPISLQSWGHQLKVDRADDPRIDEFITALRLNSHGVYPEVGATCQAHPGTFDISAPPPFDPTPPGPDAVPMNGRGAAGGGPMGR